jgi:hypothetical protein
MRFRTLRLVERIGSFSVPLVAAALLVVGAIAGGEVARTCAQDLSYQLVNEDGLPSVDIELAIAVDVSYSVDIDELVVQRKGYAEAIVSKEFLQALKAGAN